VRRPSRAEAVAKQNPMKAKVEGTVRAIVLFDHLIHPQIIRVGTARYVPMRTNDRIDGNMV
jgi:hypothetical protein